MHNICTASVSMRGSLLSLGGMVGSVYVMVSGGKCISSYTCVSSYIDLYGVLFVVHSPSGMVRIVNVSWFSFAANGPNVWLFVCFLYCVGGHICYQAICI
jgi:hypothetical protein